MKKILVMAVALACFGLVQTVGATGVAIGVRPINTLGFSGELTTTLYKDNLNLRLGMNLFSLEQQGTLDIDGEQLDYDAGVKLNSALATLDWHPWGGHFRLAPGVFYNRNEFGVTIFPQKTYTVGSKTITPQEIGSVRADVDYPDFAPYFGIGWGNSVLDGRTVRFAFDIGVVYMQSPTIELSATEMLTPTAEQGPELTEKMKDYNLWAVISFGMTFKLF